MAFDVVPLGALLKRYREEEIRKSFSSFTSVNKDVERFLHETCMQFERVGLSRTTLVYSSYQGEPVLVGYFAIALKPLSISKKNWARMSNGLHRKLMPIGYKDEMDRYTVSSILLGQLGLNFRYRNTGAGKRIITGSQLLGLAYQEIIRAEEILGGVVVYVEVDNELKLREFYTRNGFAQVLLSDPANPIEGKAIKRTTPYETVNHQQLYVKKISDISIN